MGQALYRKYRSKSLSEIVGQEHIITTLSNAVKNGSISHAYLFTGPRGVGKTSIARILAHEINDLPYNESATSIDIIEIDAASNRRIDEIRDLREKVHIAPATSKYKVYIIDEVHMLTKEAFNALLKTLEEPPAHAVFILATTEVHKLPETIISRTQRFTFKPIDPQKAVEHLRYIADQEKISISDEALELIAQHGDGSFRDSISLLDQAKTISQDIEADDIRQMLGIAPTEAISALLEATFSANPQTIIEQLKQLDIRGFEPNHIAKQLASMLRQNLLSDEDAEHAIESLVLLKKLIDVPTSPNHFLSLEVVLLETNLSLQPNVSSVAQKPKVPSPSEKPEPKLEKDKEPLHKPIHPEKKKSTKEDNAAPIDSTPKATPVTQPVTTSLSFDDAWQQSLNTIKQQYNTLYGILRMAQPSIDNNTVTLAFKFAFHQKRINEPKNKQIISDILVQNLGYAIKINCIVSDDIEPISTVASIQETTEASPVDTISNIFGGAEVLE